MEPAGAGPPEKVTVKHRIPACQYTLHYHPLPPLFLNAIPGENAPTSLLTQTPDPMALNSSRSAWPLSRQALRCLRGPVTRPTCRANHDLARHPTALREKNDPLNERVSDIDVDEAKPRWAHTPERLKGIHGFSLNHIKDPSRALWEVNEDPVKLDAFYDRFLGRDGSRMLSEDVKWLAVTHKSFDYGRRGFNTRLAYFGTAAHRLTRSKGCS